MSKAQAGTFSASLQQAHWEWRKEVGEALARVRGPEAGVWERSAAVHYLMDQFAPRLEREAHVLTAVGDLLPADQSGRVWALGELLQFLCHHLCELAAMPQCGPAFATAVTKLIRALDFWCMEIEAGVRAAESAGLPSVVKEEFEELVAESGSPVAA
jgi:hypothetical protein